jgi:uncharacterized protein
MMRKRNFFRTLALGALVAASVAGCGLADKSGEQAYSKGDYVLAQQKFKKSGSAKGTFYLGLMALKGQGEPQNVAEGVALIRKAADGGFPEAQFNVGTLYARGIGVPLDKQEAIRWYQKAATQGNSMAEFNLGVMYLTGDGLKADRNQGITWMKKSAEHNNDRAKQALHTLGL